ncbi:hypothetical protein MKW94_014243 [Papaver nudicaule]|uniref:DC1 domain-containing protein n=1 Tax=Papaver nudicaule TaxID=74823 RepID=A0AA41VKU9_PAPNU|nr:hypothetical protein [Papaver nudicaule]
MGATVSKTKKSVSPANKLHHFTHRHTLKLVSTSKEFHCKACGLPGMGLRYRCNKLCNWDIHETCATSPDVLSTHIHPDHQLNLICTMGNPYENEVERGRCGVCSEYISGRLFYACPFCPRQASYFLHPTCSTFPSRINHPLDRHHSLVWQSGPNTWCSICRKLCPKWHYRCEPCSIDVHFECVSHEGNGGGNGARGNGTAGRKDNVSVFASVGGFFFGCNTTISWGKLNSELDLCVVVINQAKKKSVN